jgi:hypothetical protein
MMIPMTIQAVKSELEMVRSNVTRSCEGALSGVRS